MIIKLNDKYDSGEKPWLKQFSFMLELTLSKKVKESTSMS